MGLSYEINFESAFGDTFLKAAQKHPQELVRQIKIGIKQGLGIIAESARNNHRFKDRTPNLSTHAIQEDVSKLNYVRKIDKLIGSVKIDPVQASYGARIHEGFGSWKPDPFIHNAGKREEKTVINLIFKRVKKLAEK